MRSVLSTRSAGRSRRLCGSLALLAGCALAIGCRERRAEGESKAVATTSASASAAASATSAAAPEAPPPAPSEVTEAELQALLAEWLRAQNAGDFASYEKLYSQKFTGKKLAGRRATEFGRAGWLADRKAMFERPFTVRANDVRVAAAPHGGFLRFEQTWSSSAYEDRGPKVLQLVREGDALRIAREEMLSSTEAGAAAAAPPPFEALALVHRTGSGPALLVPGAVDIHWSTEHPVYISDNEAVRAVSLPALPAARRALLDQDYELFDAEGRRCAARPKRFVILVDVVPHFGTVNAWTGFPDHKSVAPPAQRAQDLWRLAVSQREVFPDASRGMSLALELEAKDCAAPLWGRRAAPGAEAPWSSRAPTPEEQSQITAAARVHPETAERTRRYLESLPASERSGVTSWLTDTTNPRVFESPTGQTYVTTNVSGHPGDCNSGASSVYVWRKQGGTLVPVSGSFDESIRAVVDADGDGGAELIGASSVYAKAKSGYERVVEPLQLSLDCPC